METRRRVSVRFLLIKRLPKDEEVILTLLVRLAEDEMLMRWGLNLTNQRRRKVQMFINIDNFINEWILIDCTYSLISFVW